MKSPFSFASLSYANCISSCPSRRHSFALWATAPSFPSDRSGLPDSLWHRVHPCFQNPSRRFGSQFQALQITPTIRVDRGIVINKTIACRGYNIGRFHAAGSIPRMCHSRLLTPLLREQFECHLNDWVEARRYISRRAIGGLFRQSCYSTTSQKHVECRKPKAMALFP
jgi:hypothetical protein